MTEQTKKESPPASLDKAVADGNLGFEQRMENLMKDVFDVKFKAFEAKIDTKLDELLKTKEVEMEQALRKGFGLETDPVIHKSDLVSALRKAAVEKTEKERAPVAEVKAGPEGNKPQDAIDEAFKAYGV